MAPKAKKRAHMICNAHLDPVWLWRWDEGAAETMSTFRTAVEICEANETFVFNHNEAILYQWVEEYEPPLFKRIQKLVKQGKWHIMGGWYLQPDCNMPSGESFVRQILLGKLYFKEKFGVDVKTAINFDPFGHSRGLAQIMAKSGFDSYLFGRPRKEDGLDLPDKGFVWVGFDGSEILASRFNLWYNSSKGMATRKIEKWLDMYQEQDLGIVLWGIGNHGGGPSKKDVKALNQLISKQKDRELFHSTPQKYFKELAKEKADLHRHKDDLNPWGVGCYTSQIRIKQKHRQLENELFATEKMAASAWVYGLGAYPADDFEQASKALAYTQFHDILPGSSIEKVEDDSLRTVEHGLEICAKLKAKLFFQLAAGQKQGSGTNIPFMIYNPHPFKIKQSFSCELNMEDYAFNTETGEMDATLYRTVQAYNNGKEIATQVEHEDSNLQIDWRKKVVIQAELEPYQMNRFDCVPTFIKKKPAPKLKAKNGVINFKSKTLNISISTRTGLVEKYKANGVDYLKKNAFQSIVLDDCSDPWKMLDNRFGPVVGKFKLMSKKRATTFSGIVKKGITLDPVRVIEDGPVRSIIEVIFEYQDSAICQRYIMPKVGTEIQVQVRVYWNEKNRMLKLNVPLQVSDCAYLGQTAFGVQDLPTDGSEAVAQKWVAGVSKENDFAFSCINDGIYGSDYKNGAIQLSLLRSPAYSSAAFGVEFDELDPYTPQDRFTPRIDQGLRTFNFWFNGGTVRDRLNSVDREALTRNETPYPLSFFPSGAGKKLKPLVVLDDKVVQIAAVKKAVKSNHLIVRLFEPTGKKRSVNLKIHGLKKKVKVDLGGFEVKTLKIHPKSGKVVEANLLEQAGK